MHSTMKSIDIKPRRWLARAAAGAFVVMMALAMVVQDADAARMGGGRSFGRQSPNVTRQAAPPTQSAPAQQAGQKQTPPPAAQPQPSGNRWLGPIAGLAAGLGIAALLSHFGLGGAFAEALGSMLVVGLLVLAAVWIWRMLRGAGNKPALQRTAEPSYGSAGDAPVRGYDLASETAQPGSVAALGSAATSGSAAATPPTAEPWGVPAGFDTPAFIRSAKVNFIRLQEAWDAKNLGDIREFTTPEVFAEIKMQIDETKGANNHTDVVALDAELLGIEESPTDYLASVKFSGTIRENEQGNGEPVEEVWNLTKPKNGRSGWLLAGIQQIH
jgi:predicted lipid-binding transport protein (Tim44 family)